MARRLRVHYETPSDQRVVLMERDVKTGQLTERETVSSADGYNTYISNGTQPMVYRWGLKNLNNGEIETERHDRYVPSSKIEVIVTDEWRSPYMWADALRAKAFSTAVFEVREGLSRQPDYESGDFVIELNEPRIAPGLAFCVVSKQLINWNRDKAYVMTEYAENTWRVSIPSSILMHNFEFKFGLWNVEEGCFVEFETGINRVVSLSSDLTNVFTFNSYNYEQPWRVAGVAVPVFSLRTSKSRGCGEFLDLKYLADWCVESGLKVIQLLPINDTTATRQWRDSYPYNSISCMALHPSYISVDRVYDYYGARMKAVEREDGLFLNDLNMLEYNRTREWKNRNLLSIFKSQFDKIIAEDGFKSYLKDNAWWVKDYSLFAALRNEFDTPDFRKWGSYSKYNPKMVDEAFAPGNDRYQDVMFRVFLQYHLEMQIREAIEYVHSKNIALKGDLPIGINPNSVEAWVEPDYFDFELQAGAPPDFFSRDGQNWGFPVYNWERMSEDNYGWWQRRFGRMQQFFDLFRIDHILGFFRIWSIPKPFSSGLMGIFSPAMPYTKEELLSRGFAGDPEYYSKPVVSYDFLVENLREYADTIISAMFDSENNGWFRLKDVYFNPNETNEWIDEKVILTARERIRQGMANIMHEVLFVSVKAGEWHPRIMLTETQRFRRLTEDQQNIIRGIHDDFFYGRHNEFWRKNAIEHLEAMLCRCEMLVCGEDLGMIPASVPEVMKRLQILALEIQRMPKLNWERYGTPSRYDYMTVCATSSHDISSIRGWWEENRDETQWYYNNMLGHGGEAPAVANEGIVREVIMQHLNSPSMLCINPIQDYAGMVDNMPHLLPFEERINDPANANQMWRYRIPFDIDTLGEKYPELQRRVRSVIEASGRTTN